MKFAHYIRNTCKEAPVELQQKFLNYKDLKKELKAIRSAAGDENEVKIAKNKFFDLLDKQIDIVNGAFEDYANGLLKRFDEMHDRHTFREFCSKVLCRLVSKPGDPDLIMLKALGDDAEWCRRFANINAVATRKIVKKFDKTTQGHEGQERLQAYWSGNKQDKAMFLHSPLLTELKALEVLLAQEQVIKTENKGDTIEVELSQPDQPERNETVSLPRFPSDEFIARNSPPVEVLGDAANHDEEEDDDQLDPGEIPGQESIESVGNHFASGLLLHRQGVEDGAHVGSELGSPGDQVGSKIEPLGALKGSKIESPEDHKGSKIASPGDHEEPTGDHKGSKMEVPGHHKGKMDFHEGKGTFETTGLLDGPVGLHRSHSMASSGLTEDVEDEYKCPICLEPMYHPIGLSCGHTFCADCAFCAVGKAYSLGTVRAIMMNVPDEAMCPECRKPGVFHHAREMKGLGRVIKTKYPEAWAAKREEMKEKTARLRELLARQRAAELGVFRPYG
eukprot:jgi/Botrbrau1/4489/Bobra.0220s0023.1